MPIVQMPDGTHVDMPDNPTPEQLSALQSVAGSAPGLPERIARTAAAGFGKMAQGTLRAAAMLMPEGAAKTLNDQADSGEQFWEGVQAKRGLTNPYARSAVEGAGAALAGPGSLAARVLTGAAAGAGGEAGSELTNGNPIGRTLGTLAGGVGGGAAVSRISQAAPTVTTLSREALGGIPATTLAQAKAFQAEAAAKGVKLDLAQALEGVGKPNANVTTLRNVVAGSRNGDNVQGGLAAQPGQVATLAQRTVGGLPGTVLPEGDAANALADTATKVIGDVKKARSSLTTPLYNAAGVLPNSVPTNLSATIDSFIQQPGISPQVVSAARDLQKELLASSTNGAPRTHALDIKAAIDDAMSKIKLNQLNPMNPKDQGNMKYLAGQLYGQLGQADPVLGAANLVHGQVTANVVDPLKRSVVGTLAGRQGAQADLATPTARLNSLFEAGTDPLAKTSAIRTAGNSLSAVNPDAFADAAQTFYSGKIAKALEPSLGPNGVAAPSTAADLSNTLFGNQKQWQGMKDVASVVAKTHGVDEAATVRGLESLGQILKASANRPAVAGTSPSEMFQIAGKSYGADALRVAGFLPFQHVAKGLEAMTMRNTFATFDKLLTTPEGVDTLAKLGSVPVMSQKAQVILNTWLAGQGQGQPTQQPGQ